MSAPGLTSEAQLRYILQWFGEFSELQREDFLPMLAAARSDKSDQLAAMLAKISCQDKPVSLFQCRIKLFNEWFPTWAEEEQDRLIKGVSEVDPDFGTKLQEYITNGPKVNGEQYGNEEFISGENGTNEPNSFSEDYKDEDNYHENREAAVDENAAETPVVSENIHLEIVAAS